MNKVTKLLLVAGVAAIGLGGFSACSDSVTVVEPAPPPEPPEIPPVEATVTIQGIRQVTGTLAPGTPVDPTNVDGSINVLLNVAEGDETITSISLVLDGVNLGCQAVSASTGDVQASTAGATDVVECFLKTHEAEDVCVGEQLANLWDNDEHVLGAQIVTAGGTRTAANEQTLTFNNTNYVMIVPFGTFQSFVSPAAGIRYYGGPSDLDGDGTDDNLVQFAACPIRFDGVTIDEMWVVANTDMTTTPIPPLAVAGPTAGDADLGSGPGLAHASNSPFIYLVDYDDNQDKVEDAPGGQGLWGHTIRFVNAFDDAGVDVGLSFNCPGLTCAATDLYVDMTGPQAVGGMAPEIYIGGAPIVMAAMNTNTAGNAILDGYYSTGAFSLHDVGDLGVGFAFGQGAVLDVEEHGTDDQDFPDVENVDDIDEDDGLDTNGGPPDGSTADQGGLDAYEAELKVLQDYLQNAGDETIVPVSTTFGKDATAGTISNMMPAGTVVLNPDANADGGTCADLGDCTLMFDAVDPDLPTGDAGTLLDDDTCNAPPGGCANITAELDVAPTTALTGSFVAVFECDGTIGQPAACTDELVDEDFSVDLTNGDGPGLTALPDGNYEVIVEVPDNAIPGNDATHTFIFTLDDTAPTFGALNPAPVGSAGTDATAIVFTIGGSVNDANIVDTATVTVEEILPGTGTIADCGTGTVLTTASGRIDRNGVDITDGTKAISFTESFTVTEPVAGSQFATYCFTIFAEDVAVLKDGTDQGNNAVLNSVVTVQWN